MLIVFVDQYLPFDKDRDFVKWHLKFPSIAVYFEKLNKFFEKVEKKYNTKVVIAIHPDSIYEGFDYFNGRELIKGKAKELLGNADLVLGHYSNALRFAKGKRILSLTFDELDTIGITDCVIKPRANPYGVEFINIDKEGMDAI